MKWRVSAAGGGWTVTSPGGGTELTRLPSQPAAFGLARSLAEIDVMLARVHRPKLTVVADPPKPKRRDEYGFGPIHPRRQQQS